MQRLKRHDDAVMALYSPEGYQGNVIFSASADEVVRLWDMADRSISKPISFKRPKDNKLMPYRMTDDQVRVADEDESQVYSSGPNNTEEVYRNI